MPEGISEIRPHDKVLLIAVLKRALDDASTKKLVNDVLTAAGETPRVPVVLDMTQVRFAPSVALGELVQLSKSFKLDGRRLALVGVDPNVMGAIRVTNLHTILEIHPTLDSVLK